MKIIIFGSPVYVPSARSSPNRWPYFQQSSLLHNVCNASVDLSCVPAAGQKSELEWCELKIYRACSLMQKHNLK